MRIIQIHNCYREKGGEDAVVAKEADLLAQANHQVIKSYAYNRGISKLWQDRRNWYHNFNKECEEMLPDVAHIHNIYQVIGNEVYKVLNKRNIPIIQTLHNYRFLCANAQLFDRQHTICERCSEGNFLAASYKKCYRNSYLQSAYMAAQVNEGRKFVLRYVDYFIAVSEFIKTKYVEHGFPADRIIVKPNSVAQPEYNIQPVDGGYALFLGRLSPEKGVATLIEAFKDIDFPLVIAGVGPQFSTLSQQASSSPNIRFVGFADRDQKHKLLEEATFVVVPSEWYEPFGLVVDEAFVYGKPVIAAKIGALQQIVSSDERLFHAGDVEGLKLAVLTLLAQRPLHFLPRENIPVTNEASNLTEIYLKAKNSEEYRIKGEG